MPGARLVLRDDQRDLRLDEDDRHDQVDRQRDRGEPRQEARHEQQSADQLGERDADSPAATGIGTPTGSSAERPNAAGPVSKSFCQPCATMMKPTSRRPARRPMLGAERGPTPESAAVERAGVSRGAVSVSSRVNRGVSVMGITIGLPPTHRDMHRWTPRGSLWGSVERVADKLETYRAQARLRRHARAGRRRRRRRPRTARFVIQEHHATRLHWDLRLEHDGALASWAVPNGLPEEPKDNRLAVRTEDHPLEYLDFHGEIPKGYYGAGTMTIWDRGTYEVLKWEPRKVEVALHGERVQGRYALFPIDKGEDPKDWMIHRMDPPADADARADARQDRADAGPPRRRCRATTSAGRSRSSGTACARSRYSEPGRLRFHTRNLQRHHAALSRAGAAQPRAEPPPRDPRRRDRRLRRRGPAELRRAPAADAPHRRERGAAAGARRRRSPT